MAKKAVNWDKLVNMILTAIVALGVFFIISKVGFSLFSAIVFGLSVLATAISAFSFVKDYVSFTKKKAKKRAKKTTKKETK